MSHLPNYPGTQSWYTTELEKPTQADADAVGNIFVVKHHYNGIKYVPHVQTMNWDKVNKSREILVWAPIKYVINDHS